VNRKCDYCSENAIHELWINHGEYIFYCEKHHRNAIDEFDELEQAEQNDIEKKMKNSTSFLEFNTIISALIAICISMVLIGKYYLKIDGDLNWKLIIPSMFYVVIVGIWNTFHLLNKKYS
jgi:Na+/glutamate symporter